MTYTTEFPTSKENFHWKLNQHLSYGKSWEKVVGLTHLIAEAPRTKEFVKLTFQGRLVKAQIMHISQQPWKRGMRGQITDFSSGSRGRFFELINRIDFGRKCVFLTLTFGDEFPDVQTAKNALRAFLERMRRKFTDRDVSAIWRMEFQERGAPHFHLIFFNLPWIDKKEIQRWWSEIINVSEPFTRIEMIYSVKKLVNYVAKYLAKVDIGQDNSGFNSPTYLHAYAEKYDRNIGRLWGYYNKHLIPFFPLTEITWPTIRGEFMEFRQIAAKFYPPIDSRFSLGFKLYCQDARQWANLFDNIHERRNQRHRQLDRLSN